jgi:iduronate 2-sulfatase
MNSSTMPDKYQPEEKFRDYEFTQRALKTWKKMLDKPNPFMLAIGFKLPHLAIHVPYKYYEMYKGAEKKKSWHLAKKELRFPTTTHEISYRCCADGDFHYMREEGSLKSNRSTRIGEINSIMTEEMHDEMMMGYAAGITFVDKLLGMFLDFMDNNNLWSNTIVVLTSDHGMHNGEKGIW